MGTATPVCLVTAALTPHPGAGITAVIMSPEGSATPSSRPPPYAAVATTILLRSVVLATKKYVVDYY